VSAGRARRRVDVDANRIRLTYGTGKNTTRGNETVQTSESFEKIIPLPENADPSGFEVRKGKDTLTLVFRKTGHPA